MNENKKIKLLIAYLVMLLLLFGIQNYFVYFHYIPTILAAYATNEFLHAHIEKVLYNLAGLSRLWFLVLAGSVTGLIVGIYIAAKKVGKNK